jgi:hypothetical protein
MAGDPVGMAAPPLALLVFLGCLAQARWSDTNATDEMAVRL